MHRTLRNALLVPMALVAGLLAAAQAARPAMMRSGPRVHEIRLEVELFQQAPVNINYGTVTDPSGQRVTYAKTTPTYTGRGVVLGIPVLVRTSWCDTDFTGMAIRASVDGREYPLDPARAFERAASGAEATVRVELPFERGYAESILARVTYQVQQWDLAVDESAAGAVAWPREWPSGMDRFLRTEPGIDPSDKRIREFADSATNGGARAVTPYFAARNAALAVSRKWHMANVGTSLYGQKGGLRGISFTENAPWGLEAGGTPVELAATSVAAIRSLGIPSRVVYCLASKRSRDGRRSGSSGTSGCEFRMICEFFIPTVGWIPFDPMVVRQHLASRTGDGPISGFANVPKLEEALPLAYGLVPTGFSKADRFALWGWTGGIAVDEDTAVSRIGFEDSGRGNGKIPSMPAPVSDERP